MFALAPLIFAALASRAAAMLPITTWHVLWVGGQSNSVGTNTQTSGYPTWPLSPSIQMFCWRGACNGTFTAAHVPLYNEANVGWALTVGNLLQQTLPDDHGVVLVNTGVGGTGFYTGAWLPPNGPLAVQSVRVMKELFAALPTLGGNATLEGLLWHQ